MGGWEIILRKEHCTIILFLFSSLDFSLLANAREKKVGKVNLWSDLMQLNFFVQSPKCLPESEHLKDSNT